MVAPNSPDGLKSSPMIWFSRLGDEYIYQFKKLEITPMFFITWLLICHFLKKLCIIVTPLPRISNAEQMISHFPFKRESTKQTSSSIIGHITKARYYGGRTEN